MSRVVLFDPKLTSHVDFSNFQAEEYFSNFQNFLYVSMRKEQQQPPDWSSLLKFGQNMS